MSYLMPLLAEYGLYFVFICVLVEQAGAPIPAFPVLLAVGALASRGQYDFGSLLGTAIAACVIADSAWYFVGKRLGPRVLRVLCRVSLSPESCISQTESLFTRWGAPSLMVAKFVPGFASIATVVAGAMQVRTRAFLGYSTVGSALWSGSGLALGWAFAPVVGDAIRVLEEFGHLGVAFIGLALCGFVAWKWWKRRQLNERLRVERITVGSLAELVDRGASPVIVDVRLHIVKYGGHIPGAVTVNAKQWAAKLQSVPRDALIVVYCACPEDAGAAMVAVGLMRRGYSNVRPLAGGIDAWLAAGRPLQPDYA
jgi:membrane protein DedA with SNARE-associated domain/rhodanese-related sulfurtransferase